MEVAARAAYLPRQEYSSPPVPHQAAYRPEIDGLRALAVILVMLCHAQFAWLRGGFIGVDVFFTISGYVVALAILRSQERGEFALLDFYARRLRRLAPSLYMVLAATVVFCALYCFPQDTYSVLKNSLLTATFYSNIYLSKQTGYFAPDADRQALLHTWSLSVEEQFYLLFPLLLLALRTVRPALALVVIGGLFLLTFLLSQHAVDASTPQAYFKLQYRAFEFLAGSALAMAQRMTSRHAPRPLHEFFLLAGLGAIGYSAFNFSAQTAMPGVHALIPCAGVALVIAGGQKAKLTVVLLKNRGMVYLGKLSYVVYLWHWPLMFALRRLELASTGWMLLAIAMSLALGTVTHHFVEQPMRQVRWSIRKTFFALLLVPVVVAGGLLFAANETDNFSGVYPEKYRLNYEATGHSVFETARAKKCWGKIAVTRAEDCSVGDASISVNAVLWGDSHAYHLIDFMDRLGKDQHLRLHDLTMTMCPPNEHGPARAGDSYYQSYREECLAHNKAAMAYILSQDAIKTVVMSAVWSNYENPQSLAGARPSTHGYMPGDTYLAETLEKLSVAGKRVVFVDDIPTVPPALDNCLSNRLYLPTARNRDCSYDENFAIEQHRPTVKILTEMERRFPGTATLHTFDVPCNAGRCATEVLGVPLYRNNDTGHLGLGGSRIYYDGYRQKHPEEINRIFG
jgi:peptidoglycan/LPS O-acetylase OafA/YrhL